MFNDAQEVQGGVIVTLQKFYLYFADENLPATLPLLSAYALDENGLLINVLENIEFFYSNTSPDKLPGLVFVR